MHPVVVYLAIISFAFGIAWQSVFKLNATFVAFLFALCFAGVILLIRYRAQATIFTVIVCMFALGVLRMQVAQVHDAAGINNLVDKVGTYVDLIGTIVAEPDKREHSTNLVVLLPSFGSKVLVRASQYGEYEYGDTVEVKGELERVENFISDTGKEFDYIGYLAKDDVFYIIRRSDIDILSHADNLNLKGILFALKAKYLQNIARSIPEPESALAGGITVGAKSSMGKELLEQFRKTGVIHIVVLSGFNVAIVAMFFTYIFGFFGVKLGRVLAIFGIILFAVLTGGGATVVRASAMGILAILALTVRRKYVVLRALFIVGFFMLLYNPKVLLSDISFQLSFVATLGIILGMPILQRWLRFVPSTLKLREIVSATVATQIFVAPLLLYYMGEISIISIVANVLVLPLVTISMLFVFLTGVSGFVGQVVALPFAYISYWLLHSIVTVVQTLSGLPHITVGVSGFNLLFVLLAYTAIALWVLCFKPAGDDTPVYIV